MARSDAVIVGYGQTDYHKRDQRLPIWYIADAIRRALVCAGIEKSQVDGLAISSFQMPPDNPSTVAEQLGFSVRWIHNGVSGGASQVTALLHASRAIENGDAETIVLVAADAYSVASHTSLMNQFNTGMRDYLAPYDTGGTNGLFAMIQRRHMHDFGTTREQLGKLAVTQRMHAQMNPNALLREPLTLEEYLNARMIADPIRLYDCVLPCGGGEAVVVTTRQNARKLRRRPVNILSGGEYTNFQPKEIVMLSGGWTVFRERIFQEAGLAHADIDAVQLYDDYPIMELIQLEDLGFCAKGEGGTFLEATDFSITGDLPLNTGGGQLSCGQSGMGGGGIGLTEAVLQLQGDGNERQVPDIQTCLVSGFGMVGYGRGLSASAVILSNML